jgi:DNA-binding winged helix-turn-helix (wHTH) protein
MTASKSFVFRFADIEVREQEFCLIKAGEVLTVEPKAFRVLLYLLRHPQKLISKDELLNAVWDDASVTENSLSQNITKLRRVLHDDVRNPRYIETVPTVGYRLVCKVEIFEDVLGNQEPPDERNGPDGSNATHAPAQSAPLGTATDHQVQDELDRHMTPFMQESPVVHLQSVAKVEEELQERHTLAYEPVSGIDLRVFLRQSKRPRVAIPVLIILLALGSLFGWWLHRISRARWARDQATPEIGRLLDSGEFVKAAMLARDARTALPNDPTLDKLWMDATGEVSIASVPFGADVSMRPYRGDANVWEALGTTPLKKIRVPRDQYVWRIVKPGFTPMFFIDEPSGVPQPGERFEFNWTLKLRPEGSVPPEMLLVAGGWVGLSYPTQEAPGVEIGDFLIDRHEVTNEQYKKFVDAGGYQKREFWKQPFLKDGKSITWEQAVTYFHDATGRPGPANWEVGSYPNGMEQHPVAGVSWYEAAAYAEFAGKSLTMVIVRSLFSFAKSRGTVSSRFYLLQRHHMHIEGHAMHAVAACGP